MKKMYKFTAVFLAVLMMLPFGMIHASAYDDCDVNHDGYVNVSDAVALELYLSGDHYASDYNRFDTNKSLTVDSADVDKILATISLQSYSAQFWDKENFCGYSFPTVSGFTPDSYASSTSARLYRKYVYSTQQDSTYYLTPATAAFNNNSAPLPDRAIVGSDDRVESSGTVNTGIVRLNGIGTGFIVGDHVIATAAHNVYNRGFSGGYFKWDAPTIHPYNTAGTMLTTTSFTPVEVHVPYNYGYALTDEEILALDYALITVSDDLSNYYHFSLGTTYNVSSTNYSNIPLYVLGPYIEGDYVVNQNELFYGQGNILEPIADNYTTTFYPGSLLYYDCDTCGGDSGAPVYTITQISSGGVTYFTYSVLAIHTQGDPKTLYYEPAEWNAGVRITKYQLQFYYNNTNISY